MHPRDGTDSVGAETHTAQIPPTTTMVRHIQALQQNKVGVYDGINLALSASGRLYTCGGKEGNSL